MRLTAIAAGLTLAAAPALAGDHLAVLNWSDYVAPGVVEAFAAETGLRVRYDTYANSEAAESRLLAGASGYDVAVVSSEYLGRLIEAGAAAPLDAARLGNLGNVDRAAMARLAAVDPGGRHAVPYLWGTTGLAYDAAAIAARAPDAPTESWAMVFDPAWAARFADCGIGIVDEPEEVLSAALLWLGRDPGSAAPEDVDAALAAIRAVSRFVRRFDSEQVADLAEGRLCLGVSWSADTLAAEDAAAEGVDLRFSLPAEGANMWIDVFVIPADAPNPEAAHRFIDYMLRADVAAANANSQYAASGNAAALPLIDAAALDDPRIYPPAETMARLYGLAGRGVEAKRVLARRWSRLKLGLPDLVE